MRAQIVLAALLAVFCSSALAAEPMVGNPSEGQHFAREVCAECHEVEPGGITIFEPPSFADIAADPKTTETSLRVFLQTTHIEMPNFMLSEQQTDDIVAYILSLKPAPTE